MDESATKSALKSLDVVDETRAKWTWRMRNSQGLGPKNPDESSEKDSALHLRATAEAALCSRRAL